MSASLLVRRGALGDTVLVEPLLRAMRAHRPDAALHVAGQLEHVELLELYGVADHAFSIEDLMLWARSSPARAAPVRERLDGYEWIVADQPLGASVTAKVTAVDPQLDGETRIPAAAALLERLRRAVHELPAVDPVPRLRPARLDAVAPAEVWLHPGSGGERKCWPLARFLAVAAALAGAGTRVVLVLGPVESERRGVADAALPAGVDLVRGLALPELCRGLERAACFVGNDAGVTHLAAALAVPTVAVFGPTRADVWAPQGPHVRVVGRPTEGPPDASVDEVLAAVEELVPGPLRGG
ncbi:MAG: glycosyltransferase family 9 protein [Planctomycetota bacterium]